MLVLGVLFAALDVVLYRPFVRRRSPARDRTAGATGPRVSAWSSAPTLSRGARTVVATFASIVGVGALFGGYGLLTDPVGLGVKHAWLDGTPFPDYTVPGVVLLVVFGGGMLFTAATAVRGASVAARAAFVMGLALLGWGTVETATIGYQGRPQIVLLTVFVVGPAVPLLRIGWRTVRRSRYDRPEPSAADGRTEPDTRECRPPLGR
jgi:hypothetical protein